jgi:hypothetical protein
MDLNSSLESRQLLIRSRIFQQSVETGRSLPSSQESAIGVWVGPKADLDDMDK